MSSPFTAEQIKDARQACIYDFMRANYGSVIEDNGASAIDYHPSKGRHIIIQAGKPGAYDNSQAKRISSIDFLCDELGYEFKEAVATLTAGNFYANAEQTKSFVRKDVKPAENTKANPATERNTQPIELPPKSANHNRVYAYLTQTRGIPGDTVNTLFKAGLLYQDMHYNCCFVNRDKTFVEQKGTSTYVKWQSNRRQNRDDYWSLRTSQNPKTVYITEASIDAVSLYVIHKELGVDQKDCMYVALGGSANQQTINRIKKDYEHVVMAVDNDQTGGLKARERNQECPYILPISKDWNEDLKRGLFRGQKERYEKESFAQIPEYDYSEKQPLDIHIKAFADRLAAYLQSIRSIPREDVKTHTDIQKALVTGNFDLVYPIITAARDMQGASDAVKAESKRLVNELAAIEAEMIGMALEPRQYWNALNTEKQDLPGSFYGTAEQAENYFRMKYPEYASLISEDGAIRAVTTPELNEKQIILQIGDLVETEKRGTLLIAEPQTLDFDKPFTHMAFDRPNTGIDTKDNCITHFAYYEITSIKRDGKEIHNKDSITSKKEAYDMKQNGTSVEKEARQHKGVHR